MLEYTKAGDGGRLAMLVLHDDEARVRLRPCSRSAGYQGRDIHAGPYDHAKKDGWIVISMKDDWKRIFAFEE